VLRYHRLANLLAFEGEV
jgi:hypothetical protein